MEEQDGVSRRGLVAAERAGRGGDRVLGHLTPGELVVPKSCQTPELMALFAKVAHAAGLDPNRFIVGSPEASRNPRTGLEEFLEGDTGGVGDTGSSASPGGTGASASGHGGENAAHGETGNQAAGYGPAGPNDGFGSYSGSAAVAGNQDALSPGFFDDPIGYITGKLAVNGKQPGVLGTMVSTVAPPVGLAMNVAPAVARSLGDGITETISSITGLEASAPPGIVDYSYDSNGNGSSRPSDTREFIPAVRKRRGLLMRAS